MQILNTWELRLFEAYRGETDQSAFNLSLEIFPNFIIAFVLC